MVSKWPVFLADKYIVARRSEKSNTTQKLSILGLATGVITLVAVMSIMNGLQQGFINDILEIESYHLRILDTYADYETRDALKKSNFVKSYAQFIDVQTLLRGRTSRLDPVLVRLINPEDAEKDKAFLEHLGIDSFEFSTGENMGESAGAVIGNELARFLHVNEGDKISIVSMTGSSFTSLRPGMVELRVSGIFRSGYYEFDRGMIFLSDEYADILNPGNRDDKTGKTIGIKLNNRYRDIEAMTELKKLFPGSEIISWREYNKSFFSALRIEKITMMLLIALIFVVIGVNIYNSIKRTVAEKLEDIAVLYAIGAPEKAVRRIFLYEGIIIGLAGGIAGIAGGLFIIININEIFEMAGIIFNHIVKAAGIMASAAGLAEIPQLSLFPQDYFYLEGIPVKVFLYELVVIFIFSLLSSFLSAYFASKKLSVRTPAEYLRYE